MSATRQRRPSPAEQLSSLTPRWDALQLRASLATRQSDVDDCEEEATAIAHALLGIWRVAPIHPSAPPIGATATGMMF